ncbi:hypothetical protein [Clostridium estertheticum]|uniref:Uncharacterized protein n=1 Tax=Clostridium estertheticum TaxID=238834 RepID=A0AA47I5G9_9CLOT|nr:hypothetical protein [Clostridium estertheticum]MBU3155006.1 hypothetical protein [Clostridium estertheticum]WAG58825.1 hypothetical protein LL038_14300 [Clostridium estertheticum]
MTGLIFDTTLNLFARKYLVKGNEHLIKNPMEFNGDYSKVINSISEQLLLHNGVAIKVYGENIPLVILINKFGLKGVEELIEQGAIEFMLWAPSITYLVDTNPGIMPLQSGYMNSKVHCDPESSIESGLKWMENPLPRRARRSLIRKVSKIYKMPEKKLSVDAVNIGYEGYNQNLFNELGLPKIKELLELNKDERAKLCDLTTQCLELSVIAKYKYSTNNSLEVAKLNKFEMLRLKDVNLIEELTNSIFEIERVPNFTEMIKTGVINIKDIPKLRNSRNATKFRDWIVESSENCDKEEIVKEYIDSIVNSKGFFETNKGKLIKTLGVTAVTGIVGAAVAGPIGLAAGATVGRIAEPLIDVGLNLLDTYVLEGITRGWTPRHYFDKDIMRLMNQKNNMI